MALPDITTEPDIMRLHTALINTLMLVALAALAACSDKTPEPGAAIADSAFLEYVPADTPYVFATLAPLPDDVNEKFEQSMGDILGAYRSVLREALGSAMEDAGADEEASADAARVMNLIDHLSGFMSPEGMREAGIARDAKFAFYGVGILPVMRIELADADAFEAALTSTEEEAGEPMATATLDGVSYRHAGDDKVRVILAVNDSQAIATVVPATLSDDSLRAVLGLAIPAQNIADAGRLQAIADTYGFTAHMLGFLDVERIAATFTTPQTGPNAELLAMAGYSDSVLSDVCKVEIGEVAGIAPRLVTGYTDINSRELKSKAVLELRSDIADGLATLPAPVPGLGADHGGLFSFGMSIDLLAAREFYSARLDAMEADPYECELLSGLQAGVAQGRAVLQQPVPPMVYGVKGFLAVIDDIEGLDMATKQPPTSIDMRFLLATENAPGLVAMGTMFSPELAALNLQADGKPVKLDIPQMQAGPVDEAWVAMSDTAIAMAVGNGSESKVGGMLTNAEGTPPPFMSTHMDAGRYYGFVAEAMRSGGDDSPNPEISESMAELMETLGNLFERMSVDIQFTDRGIEMPSVVTLAD